MRRLHQVLFVVMWLAAGSAQATLIDRGGGLIYDTDLNITWMQNASLAAGSIYDDGWSPSDGRMSFASAQAWVSGLNYYDPVLGTTISGWRLPAGYDLGAPGSPIPAPPFSGPGCDWQPSGYDCGWNMLPRSSELVYLFYVELGNLGSYAPDGTLRPGVSGVDWGTVHTGPFINVQNYIYWSTILNPVDPTQQWRHFKFYDGRMSWRLDEPPDNIPWAVHDGDVGLLSVAAAVPEPETYALMLVGLALLTFRARRTTQYH